MLTPVYELKMYVTSQGKCPLKSWLECLDKTTRARVKIRLDRLRLGNLGDYKSIGDGICELRLHFGAGYRIYFAFEGNHILLLLCAGNKSTQKKDIMKAKNYWSDYAEGGHYEQCD